MISEIIRDKKYQSRAFLLLPMTFNVGVIIGTYRPSALNTEQPLLSSLQVQFSAACWLTLQGATQLYSDPCLG